MVEKEGTLTLQTPVVQVVHIVLVALQAALQLAAAMVEVVVVATTEAEAVVVPVDLLVLVELGHSH
jgi:hypothetical protein